MLLLVLLTSLAVVRVQAANDVQIYGGYFDARFAVSYTDVSSKGCFGGLDLGTCKPPSDLWLQDWMAAYNSISAAGTYCLSCCSNSAPYGGTNANPEEDADTWDLTCQLASTTQKKFVNVFGYEFIFLRNSHNGDLDLVRCQIPRTACSYNSDGNLDGTCVSDGSYLHGYTLRVGVRMQGTPLGLSRRQVTWCSVTTEEGRTSPTSFHENIIMVHDNSDGYALSPWWGLLLALLFLAVASAAARWLRADHCLVCGHRLIWLRRVCLPCRYYGYQLPSGSVLKLVEQKRAAAAAADEHCGSPAAGGVTLHSAASTLKSAGNALTSLTRSWQPGKPAKVAPAEAASDAPG
eukprot:TRINITY_DN688_c0_g1_i1.p1 TRINITY_DN688_c0_g1~~TRINITY_DN688_c0_g1_i1.p1  ORF type:complete len:348 (-),score=72.34 TRINITY_DN688_c0_g1_i1:303-1346(-)